MALVSLRNSQLYFPLRVPPYAIFGTSGTTAIDRTFWSGITHNDVNDDGHMVGHLRWDDGGTGKTVSAIHFVPTNVSTPVGTLRVGLQNAITGVSSRRGDGTFDRSGTIDVSTLSSNTVASVTMDTGATTYSDGDLIAVSTAFDSYTSGSFDIRTFYITADTVGLPGNALNTIVDLGTPNVLLEASDGSYGIIEGSGFGVTTTPVTYVSGDTFNEYGNRIVLPVACKVNGLWFRKTVSNSTGSTCVIQISNSGGTSLYNRTLASDEFYAQTDEYRLDRFAITEQTFAADDVVYVSLRATNATNNVGLEKINVGSNAYMEAMPGGTGSYAVKRNGGTGAFTTESTSEYFQCGVIISALDTGGGSSGGLITHPGMSGGMRG